MIWSGTIKGEPASKVRYSRDNPRPIRPTEHQCAMFYARTIPEPNSGCLLWFGSADPHGYGLICVGPSRTVFAHRFAWVLVHGDPGTKHVLHRCDNPACTNVDHLFLGSHADNMRDKATKGRCGTVRGEAHRCAKLTDAAVVAIRNSNESGKVLGARYGVSEAAIYQARTRKKWRHVS